MSRAIVLMPLIQTLILVYAATFEIKNIDLLVIDRDGSSSSIELTTKFGGSKFFQVKSKTLSNNQIHDYLAENRADVALVIPSGFEKDFRNQHEPSVQLLVDAIDGMAAEISLAYCRATIADFNREVLLNEEGIDLIGQNRIDVSSRFWFNPLLDYKIYMAPGILGVLITAIGWFLAGMNLVKEKESGTIEQLNVTPIHKYQFIAGKLIPFLIIALVDMSFGLVLAKLLFNMPFQGSLITLFIFATIYLVAVLGIGLFISTISNTQQQVLFISFFFVMIFVLMSGLFTPLENMPKWGVVINWFNPLAYFNRVFRMVLLKGSTILDIRNEIYIMLAYGFVVNTLAIWRYRKVA